MKQHGPSFQSHDGLGGQEAGYTSGSRLSYCPEPPCPGKDKT